MTEKRHVVRVSILGEDHTIRSDASPEHTRAVAAHVDGAIRRVMNAGNLVEPHKAAILAALQITDELFQAQAAAARLDDDMRALSADMLRWLPPRKRPDTGEHPAIG